MPSLDQADQAISSGAGEQGEFDLDYDGVKRTEPVTETNFHFEAFMAKLDVLVMDIRAEDPNAFAFYKTFEKAYLERRLTDSFIKKAVQYARNLPTKYKRITRGRFAGDISQMDPSGEYQAERIDRLDKILGKKTKNIPRAILNALLHKSSLASARGIRNEVDKFERIVLKDIPEEKDGWLGIRMSRENPKKNTLSRDLNLLKIKFSGLFRSIESSAPVSFESDNVAENTEGGNWATEMKKIYAETKSKIKELEEKLK